MTDQNVQLKATDNQINNAEQLNHSDFNTKQKLTHILFYFVYQNFIYVIPLVQVYN